MKPAARRSWIAVLAVLSTVSLRAQDGVVAQDATQPWWLELIIPTVDIVLTAVLAGIALYFTRQQMRIHRLRVVYEERERELLRQHELFDRRWGVYAGVLEYVDVMTGEMSPESMLGAELKLRALQRKAHFLLGPDIDDYFQDLVERGAALRRRIVERNSLQGPDDPAEADTAVEVDLTWMAEQYRQAEWRFDRYLRLSGRINEAAADAARAVPARHESAAEAPP